MKKLFIVVACVTAMALGGCVSDCGKCDAGNKPTVQAQDCAGRNS